MNCKPGDVAQVVSDNPRFRGRLVEVIHAAPVNTEFRLPDGYWHAATGPCRWGCRFIEAPVIAQLQNGMTRLARYASIHDKHLRPLRDPDADVAVERETEMLA